MIVYECMMRLQTVCEYLPCIVHMAIRCWLKAKGPVRHPRGFDRTYEARKCESDRRTSVSASHSDLKVSTSIHFLGARTIVGATRLTAQAWAQ